MVHCVRDPTVDVLGVMCKSRELISSVVYSAGSGGVVVFEFE